MKKYILIAIIILQTPIHGQTLKKVKFVLYEDVLNELQTTKNITGLKNKYNYAFILLLDSTKIELIKKTGYPYIAEFKSYAAGLPLSTQTIGFVTDKTEIKEIFKDENSLKRILTCSQTYNSPDIAITKFDFPIYIKGNTAIFDTYGPTWSDTYFARLENGILQINWLERIIE